MWRLARESGVLEDNSEYSYHMFAHFFGDGSVIAELDGRPVGFIAGFRPPDRPDTTFVWQIAVDQECRGRRIASAMLHGLVAGDGGPTRVRYLEATVTPSNEPSQRTFRAFARAMDAPLTETVLFPGDRFGGPLHEDEILFRIGPFDAAPAPEHAPRTPAGVAR